VTILGPFFSGIYFGSLEGAVEFHVKYLRVKLFVCLTTHRTKKIYEETGIAADSFHVLYIGTRWWCRVNPVLCFIA
jgi:hypothetical protein